MKQTIALISLLLLSTACVVAPPTHYPTDSVDVHGSLQPRVHFGSRSQVSIWLHPQFALPDAYIIAQNHCRGFGLWADPYTDWSYNSSVPRILNYNCLGRRPRISHRHIRRQRGISRPRVINPPRRGTIAPTTPRKPWYRPSPVVRKPRVVTPEVRPNRRPTIGTRRETGKPWEYNRRKEPVQRRETKPKREVGKPWEYNKKKNYTKDRTSERKPRITSNSRTERSTSRRSKASKPRRSTLSL